MSNRTFDENVEIISGIFGDIKESILNKDPKVEISTIDTFAPAIDAMHTGSADLKSRILFPNVISKAGTLFSISGRTFSKTNDITAQAAFRLYTLNYSRPIIISTDVDGVTYTTSEGGNFTSKGYFIYNGVKYYISDMSYSMGGQDPNCEIVVTADDVDLSKYELLEAYQYNVSNPEYYIEAVCKYITEFCTVETQGISYFKTAKFKENGTYTPEEGETYSEITIQVSGEGGGGEGGDLDMKQYEYISTQKSGIDTGVYIHSNYTVECIYEFNVYVAASAIWGNGLSHTYPHWTMYNNTYYYGKNGSEGSSEVALYKDTICKVVYNDENNNIMYYVKQADGTWQENVAASGITVGELTNYNYIIGTRPASGGKPLIGKIYSFRLYDKDNDNKLVHNFVPAKIKLGDTASYEGMYDTVTNKFLTNEDWSIGGEQVKDLNQFKYRLKFSDQDKIVAQANINNYMQGSDDWGHFEVINPEGLSISDEECEGIKVQNTSYIRYDLGNVNQSFTAYLIYRYGHPISYSSRDYDLSFFANSYSVSSNNFPGYYIKIQDNHFSTTVYGQDTVLNFSSDMYTALAMRINADTKKVDFYVNGIYSQTKSFSNSGQYIEIANADLRSGHASVYEPQHIFFAAVVNEVETDEVINKNLQFLNSSYYYYHLSNQ